MTRSLEFFWKAMTALSQKEKYSQKIIGNKTYEKMKIIKANIGLFF